MDQSILRGDLSTEFARRERAERFLRVRAALRAEAARSATIDVLRHTGGGRGRCYAMRRKIRWNIYPGMATPVTWRAT
jgi:hypothetical protein